ncbi:hypothetical protein LshimejAT787_0900930 [Lyophyllum shimeji]|uniref:Uncharacterized protein n=1 Tax=Lyophyllum shimeji TaxID=47721 RepID=A0A9P3PSP7_LYOSH|nr:hypothetical protein LshimejAT787_0900930 [Lyophyllum shimeji]
MAGFLRRKSKQEPQSKSNSAQSPPAGSQTTPLFARFGTTPQPVKEAPRIVSSPMMLSSAKRDTAGALHHSRGSRTVAQTAVHHHRDAENPVQRAEFNGAGKPRDMQAEQGNTEQVPRGYSPTQVRARPVSRVPMLDKPLPPSFPPGPSNPDPPTLAPVRSPQLSTEHPSPIQGEYAHLWSIIAGEDKQLPEPVEEPSTNPVAVPSTAHEATDQHTSRSHHASSSATSARDLSAPIPQPPSPHAGTNTLPKPPSGAQAPTPPIASSYHHPPIFDAPDQSFDVQTLTARPSTRSLSRQESLADDTTLRSDSGASTSRTTLLSNDKQHDGQMADVFGSRPMKSSYEPPGGLQGLLATEFLPNKGFDSLNPSSSPQTNRKLSPAKHDRQPALSPPSRLSVASEEKRASPPQPRPSIDKAQGSHHRPLDNMGANFSAPDGFFASQQSPNGVPSRVVNDQGRDISPPPRAHVSAEQRTSMAYNPATPPRKSTSIRSMNGPIVTGKPLIFTAMAAVGTEGPQAPNSIPPARPADQSKVWSNAVPPQQHPSPPARKDSLQNRQHPRPLPAINNIGHLGQSATPSTHQTSAQPVPVPPPKATHTSPVNGHFPPQPPVEQPTPPRTRKLSKSRAAPQSSANFSNPTSTTTTNGTYQRTPVKMRPTTPISPGRAGSIQIDSDVLGIPLDDDPFARVDGVKMLKPLSRPATPPTGTTDAVGTGGERLKSREGKKGSGSEEMLSDAGSRSVLTKIGSQPGTNMGQESIPSEHGRRVNGFSRAVETELPTVAPPVIGGMEGKDYLTGFLADPHLLGTLLGFLSFYDWCMILSLSRDVRFMIVQNPMLRETVLERFLKTVGYARWAWNEREPLSLSLQDLADYMRGVSTPTHEYARVAALYVHSLSIHPAHRDQSLHDTVHHLAASTRAYSRVVLRLRAQAEKEAAVARSRGIARGGSRPPSRTPSPTFSHSNHSYTSAHTPPPPQARPATTSFQSPLFRLKRAPLLRVFVPSPDGDWLSDKSVLECEAECRRAGIMHLMRIGDVVWDVAVGDEGNVGRLVWDGSYLIDLDYTYSPVGDLPKYMPTLAFPPSYFHRVIRTGPTSSNPVAHIDLRPWGEEIAANLQLLQDRVRTETPQGAYHNVVRWVHRSSFVIRPPGKGVRSPSHYGQTAPSRIPLPDSNMFVDPGWYGTIVVETEGTNESLADLQDRCGPGAFPPRPSGVNGPNTSAISREGKLVFRILREKSRPGEIWIRTVSPKERLL